MQKFRGKRVAFLISRAAKTATRKNMRERIIMRNGFRSDRLYLILFQSLAYPHISELLLLYENKRHGIRRSRTQDR